MHVYDFLFASGVVWFIFASVGLLKSQREVKFFAPVGAFVGQPGGYMIFLGYLLWRFFPPILNPPIWAYILIVLGVALCFVLGIGVLKIGGPEAFKVKDWIISAGPGSFLLSIGWAMLVGV